MSSSIPRPLFIDTSAFYARFNPRDECHDQAITVFDGIQSANLLYGPLYSSHAVLGELATLLNRHTRHSRAIQAVDSIYRSEGSIRFQPIDRTVFESAIDQFREYDDREISFVDHTSGVIMDEMGIEDVFTFDTDDFQTLGFTCVPEDVSTT